MVYYRTYRPQTLESLDSVSVREKLLSLLSNPSKIPHAFLFTGPKGLGKTSTARIIAKIVNCTGQAKDRGALGIDPCNSCDSCISITNGLNMDVLEIDAASNRGIDEIRELKETIKLAPLASKKKVYIIDEVHMLTTEAFNALLKTLEEPPSHALFILCTTESQKVPATILSRTTHIAFKRATDQELISSFKRIITAEKLTVSNDGLELLAQLADGGFRDGAKMLEEVVAIAEGQEITAALIEKQYHISGISLHVDMILSNLLTRDSAALLTLISTMVGEGNDIRYTLEQVVMLLHEELLRKSGVSFTHESRLNQDDLSLDDLKRLLLLLSQALADMKYAVIPQLPFELAVLEWGMVPEAKSEPQEASVKVTVQTSASDETESADVSVISLRKHAGNLQKTKALYGEKKEEVVRKPQLPPANVSVLDFSANGDITPEWLMEFWLAIIQNIKNHNHTLAGVLRGCMIKSFDRKHLIIETAYTFHREKLDNVKTKEVLEEICRTLTGKTVSVTVELKAS